MAMITPTRLGLKYAPIPTLALEYEEDLGLVENDDGTRSLYVYKESTDPKTHRRVRKKLHVVELPQLTGRSEPLTVARQLQRDNLRFLGPNVVKEQQLQRLLQLLVDHLPGKETNVGVGLADDVRASERVEPLRSTAERRDQPLDNEADDDEEENAMEESVGAHSTSMEAARDEEEPRYSTTNTATKQAPSAMGLSRTGKFLTQEDSDNDDNAEDDGREDAQPASPPQTTAVAPSNDEDDLAEAEQDEKKKKALKSESSASDDEEEVQSEELEYFSEDGSDEDSF